MYIGRILTSIVLFCIVPSLAHAMVFTEIYYDPSGTDTGHEFVEIYNDGPETVDLTGWKFFEADTNHGLTVYAGDTTLGPGEYAVIADQAAQLALDFPGIGTLLDSTFSLNNTGETLAIKNAANVIVDQVAYSSASGGSGDDMSINKIGMSWVPRTPSPGASASSEVLDDDHSGSGDDEDTDTGDDDTEEITGDIGSDDIHETTGSVATKTDNDAKTKDPVYKLSLRTDAVSTAHDPTLFDGILTRNGARIIPGKFLWSMGDGRTFQERRLRRFSYAYDKPGTYLVVLEYYTNTFDEDPFLRVTKKIDVLSGDIQVQSIDSRGSITLANNEDKDIDLSEWRLVVPGDEFEFGNNTFILAGDTIAIPATVHQLHVTGSSPIVLHNPDGLLVDHYPHQRAASNAVSEEETYTDDLSRIHDNDQQASVAGAGLSGMWPWLLGLFGVLLVVGIGCALLLWKHGRMHREYDDPEPSKPKQFSSDDIELLI